jgi:hypothetical protein
MKQKQKANGKVKTASSEDWKKETQNEKGKSNKNKK